MYTYTNSKNQSFNLYTSDVELRNGTTQTIYYFARIDFNTDKTPLEQIPDGYEVYETDRTKMPVLRKVK